MKAQRLLFLPAVLALSLAGCAVFDPVPVKSYSPDEIVAMSKAGKKPAEIVQLLKDGRAYYTLPASELARMSKEGVADEVINYLQATQLEAVRIAERNQLRMEAPFWYGSLYGPRFCYRTHRGRGAWVTCI